jgi:anti-sigma factor RsiW
MKLGRQNLHLLSGVYVLGALDSDIERDRFERHLGRCQTCIAEVRGLREVTARLAMAAALWPPLALHGRVLGAVRRARQLPPAADTSPRRGLWRGRPGQRSGWLPRLTLAAAAAGVAAALVLAVILVGVQQRLGAAQAENRAIARALAAPEVRVLARSTATGGTATVIVSPPNVSSS